MEPDIFRLFLTPAVHSTMHDHLMRQSLLTADLDSKNAQFRSK